MRKLLRAAVSLLLVLCLLPVMPAALASESAPEEAAVETVAANLTVEAKSAVLMEASTGQILYEQNPDEHLPPASVTKVMTLLLIMEAIDSGKIGYADKVTCSESAASLGGSQIWLEPGEQMTVDEMLKAIAVASANDASAAMGEHISGSQELFVQQMNERAKQLGMENTNFVNCHGLDAEGHYTSAGDIARMSRELLKHPDIFKYTTIWMESLRGGESELTNTNKLLKSYTGINGLKTGSTGNAMYCLSATALRDDMQLIAVVMGSPTTQQRFNSAARLLDYGFATWSVVRADMDTELSPVTVLKGTQESVPVKTAGGEVSVLVPKGSQQQLESRVDMASDLMAPVEENQKVGTVKFYLGDKEVGSTDILTTQPVRAMNYFDYLLRMLALLFILPK